MGRTPSPGPASSWPSPSGRTPGRCRRCSTRTPSREPRMAVNRISQETETRLVGCLEKVASLVEGGLGPTRALVKVARDEDLGPGLVRLMAQAYNNGRTNAQRKAADDLFDKTASFRLADAQAAVKELYPDQVKSAADLHREQAVSDEYGRPPRWARPEVALTKTAVALVGQAPAAYP